MRDLPRRELSNMKKFLQNTAFYGALMFAVYSSSKLTKSFKRYNDAVNSVDCRVIRVSTRHLGEIVKSRPV